MQQRQRRRRQRGQGVSEYALILGLIAVVAIGILTFAGGTIAASLTDTGRAIASGLTSDPPPTPQPTKTKPTPKPTKPPKTPKPTKKPKP